MSYDPDFIGSEIRDKTKACEERFNACFADPKLRKHQWLETGYAEFNLWSFSLSASRSGRSSLDYKIHQRTDLRERITDLLDALDESLGECLDLELLEQIDNDPASLLSPEKNPESPLHFNVFNIKAILKHLTRLQIAIRKSGTQLRHHNADTSLEYILKMNANGLEKFRCDMTQIVLSGLENWKQGEGLPKPWKNANIQLLERLVNANVKRRNRIFFATERMRNVKARQPENMQDLAMVHYPHEHDHDHAAQVENTADFFNSIALGQESLVRDFIEQDSKISDTPNEHGETPLIAAVRADKPAIVRDLLWDGAKVDALGCYCQRGQNTPALRTPLQVAAIEGKLHMIRILRENRADVFLAAPDGVNALQLATSNGHESIVDHIRSAYTSAIALVPDAQKETAKLKTGLEAIPSIGETAKKFPVIPLPQRGNPNEKTHASTAATATPRDAIMKQAPSKVTWSAIIKAMGNLRGVTYPLPPKWPEGSEVLHIDCPYCSEPLTRKQIKRAAWIRHVSEDILPYICFHEDCETPDDLYRTSEELTKHFISEHGVPCWICDICTLDIKQEQYKIFETAQLWRDHLHDAHSQVISDTEFSMLAELNMQNMVPAVNCPLCDYATSEIKPNITPQITRHIQQFSLRSLPWEARTEGIISEEPLTGKSSSARTT